MEITQIKVRFGRTYNLGNYQNCRPEAEVTAELGPEDDPGEAIRLLQVQARNLVHTEIDQVLGMEGREPEFYDGPCYGILTCPHEQLAAIVPAELKGKTPKAWGYMNYSRHSYESALRYIALQERGYVVIDCSDGDLGKLPAIDDFAVYRLQSIGDHPGTILLARGDVDRNHLPGGRWERASYEIETATYAHLLERLQEEAARREWVLIDVTDGDLSRVPPAPYPVVPVINDDEDLIEPGPEPDFEMPDDDDDDDPDEDGLFEDE